MTKIRILSGEFDGEMLYAGEKIRFWALKNELGLSASFEQPEDGRQFRDIELLAALDAVLSDETN